MSARGPDPFADIDDPYDDGGDDDGGGAQPYDPGDDDVQQAEGGDIGTGGNGGGGGGGGDDLDPIERSEGRDDPDAGGDTTDGTQREGPAPDPGEDAQRDPDPTTQPAPTEGQQAAEGADDPDADVDPTPDTAAPFNQGREFGRPVSTPSPGRTDTTPQEGETTGSVTAETARRASRGPGPDVGPGQVDPTTGRLDEGAIAAQFAASPGAASATVREEQERFGGAPMAAGATAAQLEAGRELIQARRRARQDAFRRERIETGAAEGAELDITEDEFTVEGADRTRGEVAGGVAGGRRAAELEQAADRPIGVLGPPGAIESAAGDVAFDVRDVSRAAQEDVVGFVGRGASADVPGTLLASGVSGPVARGATRGITDVTVGLPANIVEGGELAASGAEFTAGEIEERGVAGVESSARAGGEFAIDVGQQFVQQAQQRPAYTASLLGTSLVGGAGVARAAERATIRARRSVTTRGETVDFEDITTQEAADTGELPEFETSPGEPTAQAVQEVRRRAEDQPETLQSEVGESILFRSEAERLPGDVEATRGQYELPGLFASPDASPLRLDVGAESSVSSLRPRLPRPFASPQRLSAFESPDIEGMPESATGARIVRDPDTGELQPDPTTPGAQFLDVEAERGTAFVRPTGSRTRELEAIFPPGTEFTRTGRPRPVDVPGGDPATLDVFRRVETDRPDVDVPEGETLTSAEVAARSRRGGTPEGTPTIPTSPTAPRTDLGVSETGDTVTPRETDLPDTGATIPRSEPTSGFGASVPPTSPVRQTDTDGLLSDAPGEEPTRPADRVTGAPTQPTQPPTGRPSQPTEPPTGPPSEPPGTPTEPPTTPPSRPPSRPPSEPPGPPSGTPSRPPGTPTLPPQLPPRRPRDIDFEQEPDEDEVFELFEGRAQPILTDFINPLTGEVLETSPNTVEDALGF